MVVLAVAALAGVGLGIVGLVRASESSSGDVDQLIERAERAEAEIVGYNELLTEVAAERDEARAELEATQSELETADGELEESAAEITRLEGLIADLAEPFPVAIDPNLSAAGIEGSYRVELIQIACSGLDLCGDPPPVPDARIARVGGQLQLVSPNTVDVPLVDINGQLFGTSSSQSLVGPCNGVDRNPQLTMAVFADRGEVDVDASVALDGLGASIIIDAPAVDGCPAGRVWWAAQLTRVG